MRYIISPIIIFLTIFSIAIEAQENGVLSNIQNKKLNKLPVTQRLFLHLNKTIYKDTDTIWFKGYSVQGPLQQSSDISQTMIVSLLNSKREVVRSAQFLIFNGTAEGQILLPKSMGSGIFELVAYGSNMLNQDLNYIFRTHIEVVATNKEKYNFSFGFNRSFYRPNEMVDMQILTHDKYYKPHENIELIYDIWDGNKKLDDGKIKSDDDGVAYLKFPYSLNNPDNIPLKINVQAGSFEVPFLGASYASSINQALDVQLLPEGGNLVAGLMQIVAFRSVDDRGIPINISGEVIDSKGNVVTEFTTSHQGMGKFMMIPQTGEKYKLRINTPVDYKHEIKFPEILENGFALSYLGTRSGNAIFKVAKNFEGVEEITAVWQMDGLVIDTQTIMLDHEMMFSFSKNELPNGIAKLTLFDKGGEPFAERLIFTHSSENIAVDIKLNHNNYKTRSKGLIDLEILRADSLPVDANFSVLVTHIAEGINPLVPIPDIRDYTIFKTELSSPVYQPAQYFDKELGDKQNEYRTDLLMLTHGWRKFNWYYELCQKLKPEYQYYNYDLYRGVVKKGKSVVPHAQVEVLSLGRGITMTESKADENGRFWVKPEFSEKLSPSIIISTVRKNDFSRAKLIIQDRELEMRDSVVQLFHKELMPHVHHYNVNVYDKSSDIDTLFKLWDTKYIDEVTVLGGKKENEITKRLKRFSTGSTYALTQEDFGSSMIDMENVIYQLGAGLNIEDDQVTRIVAGKLVSIPVILNGVQIHDVTFSDIDYLTSDMLEGIAYVKSSTLLFQLDGAGQNGALMIWTLKGTNIEVADKEMKNKFTSHRYSRVRTFYSPKYSNWLEKSSPIPDNRITVLWDNAVKTDSLGAARISFYNGDIKGKYLINIQGVTKNYGPIFKEAIITIE